MWEQQRERREGLQANMDQEGKSNHGQHGENGNTPKTSADLKRSFMNMYMQHREGDV